MVPQGHPKSSIPKSPSTPKSLPAKEMKSPDWLTPQPMETPRSNAYYDYNERPLPTHRKGQESRLGEVTEVDEEPTRDSESGFFRGVYDFCFYLHWVCGLGLLSYKQKQQHLLHLLNHLYNQLLMYLFIFCRPVSLSKFVSPTNGINLS